MKQRPVAALIFGILSIVFGLFGLASPLMQMAARAMPHGGSKVSIPMIDVLNADQDWQKIQQFQMWYGLAVGIALLAFGFGLILLKNWARLGIIICAIMGAVYTPIYAIISHPHLSRAYDSLPKGQAEIAQIFGTVFLVLGLLFSVGYAALVLYFMTRQNMIDACDPEVPPQPQAV